MRFDRPIDVYAASPPLPHPAFRTNPPLSAIENDARISCASMLRFVAGLNLMCLTINFHQRDFTCISSGTVFMPIPLKIQVLCQSFGNDQVFLLPGLLVNKRQPYYCIFKAFPLCIVTNGRISLSLFL